MYSCGPLHTNERGFVVYLYADACRNITTQWRRADTSLRKYTSHFIWKGSKGLLMVLLWERWVGDWTELQHIDPHSYGHNSVSFPLSWAAQPGAWGLSCPVTWSSFRHLSPTDLNFLSPGLYNNLTSTLLPSSVTISHSIQPLDSQGHILINIPRLDAPVIYTGAFAILTAWPGRRSICNRLSDQLESIYNRSVLIQDVGKKTCRERWTIETREGQGNLC